MGNEHQIPKTDGHFQLTKWAKKYGGIFSLKRFKNTTLVITDRRLIKTLLDKKSNIYSHRPASLVSHLITQSDHLLVMQYGDTWRKVRKLIHQYFMESRCEKDHWKVQEAEAIQMVHDFLVAPANHMLHPKRYSNSITNSLVFGIRTKTVYDDYMIRLYDLMDKWSLVLEVGATPPVDSFYFLRLLPQWLMGNWANRALEVERLMKSLYTEVLDQVQQRRLAGVQRGSFIDHVLDTQDKNQLTDNQLLFLGGVLMEGGSDTSSSLILTIIQAMTKYPEVQARAHAEIDAAIGDERSPQWSDFSKLPYINMMIKESHRWRPVSPLGVSHAVAEDDEVNGMRVPKGSTVILNVWGMHHDDQRWKAPEHFHPDRFADFPALASIYAASGEWDKRDHFGYGAGRRICPGIHLAERNLFIGVAKLLWAFEFKEKEGIDNDISEEHGTSKGFLHCPTDYGCSVKLRSEAKRETIMREMDEANEVFARFG
ncbi:m-hydroxybenzyl alcohol hydroxylase [Zopfia rhizophila CBS 207.26]|uniref:M-hydroxybenzyl alcohol hydroxylase n=1 Tax=Zopfia rhizophila CBS 207.26 TaxID=1314779 RepID=A0A6A6DSS6_9PEZI|nr:m-hydroxybenzyl alcohol hydroxylase [Zopfia rhizophila CBS 207.26]